MTQEEALDSFAEIHAGSPLSSRVGIHKRFSLLVRCALQNHVSPHLRGINHS